VVALERCVTAISHWMSANRLKLNMEKTEWLWTGSMSNLNRLPKSALQLKLGNDTIDVADADGFLECSSRRIYAWTSMSPLRRVRRSLDSESVATYSPCIRYESHRLL